MTEILSKSADFGPEKRKLDSGKQFGGYCFEEDSDDGLSEVIYKDGTPVSREIYDEYYRQLDESECFDITLDLDLGVPFGAPVIPQRDQENSPEFVELSEKAITIFNSERKKNYKFDKNLTVNTSYASGMWCYITFQAKDADVTDVEDPDAVKTIQTSAWWGIDGARDIEFCRLKKQPSVDGKPF